MNSDQHSIDPELMRQAMRKWATGIAIVSSIYNGERHGMTVNTFTSVTLSPPLVLISLEKGSRTHGLVLNSKIFGATILNKGQQEISDRFAGRETEFLDRFQDLETYTLVSGVSLIANGLAGFDCSVVSAYETGNHTLFIGIVVAAQIGQGDQPLVYFDRSYRYLCS